MDLKRGEQFNFQKDLREKECEECGRWYASKEKRCPFCKIVNMDKFVSGNEMLFAGHPDKAFSNRKK